MSIIWYVNETIFNDDSIVQLGIVTNGAGSSSSTLTIPGYPQYNNTVVRCIATGFVDGNLYNNFSQSTLRMQGKCFFCWFHGWVFLLSILGQLSDVVDLSCTRQGHCCINCSWSPPFSLDGVPIYGYIINVTNEGDNTQYTTTSNTTSWIYCPSKFDKYTVSIAGNNSAGEGDIIRQFIVLPKSKLYYILYESISMNMIFSICDKLEY